MTTASLTMTWLQLLALLAAEVGLIAVGVALLLRWCTTAAWRRIVCQAGIIAVLVVTACELSGSARVLGSWAASALTWRKSDSLPQRVAVLSPAPATPITLNAALGSEREVPTAEPTSPSADEESLIPPLPAPPEPAFPVNPAGGVARPSEAVSDSMGVLWLCVIWAIGAAVAGGRACLAQCLIVIFPLRRRPVVEPALAGRVQVLARALGLRRRVRVIESKRLTGPIAFGLIRPTVGWPPGFAGRFDAARQDAMLAHELAHLAAHDPFWCLLADVATAVLWWHPGVWWLRRQLHLAGEMAADEASLLVADGPRVLAECLVELGARLTRPVLLGELRVSGFRSHLGRRVQELVRLEGRAWSPPPRVGAAMVRILGPIAMTAFVVLCTAWAAPQALMKGDSMKTVQLNWKRSLATFALLAAFNGPQATVAVAQPDQPAYPPPPAPEVAPATPQTFDIDFGSGAPSEQAGPAAAGSPGDYWNTVSIGYNDHHTESDLKFASGAPSPIEVEMINLGGGWVFPNGHSAMGARYPMLDTLNYPTGNKGGNSRVILHYVPAGQYNLYIYGYNGNPRYYGDYTLTVGAHEYGRKQTFRKKVPAGSTKWVEGGQYVKFSNVQVGELEEVEVLIRPGLPVTDPSGRTFADAMVCGLQLVPVSRPRATATGSRSAGCVPVPPGLVSWWPGDGDGSDVMGRNPGTLQNGLTCAPGKVGRAFDLNGRSQYVSVPDSDSLNPTKCITVEAWIYPRLPLDAVAAPIIKKAGGGGPWRQDNGYALELYGSRQVRFGVFLDGNNTWYLSDCARLPADRWSHVAGVYDGAHVLFYFDGELVGTPLVGSGRIVPSSLPLQIGHDPSNPQRYFNGLIDEASVYDTALSAAQIRAIYQAGSAGKCRPKKAKTGQRPSAGQPASVPPSRGLVSRWRAEGDARDSAGGNNGTLGNGVAFVPGKVGQAFSFDRDYHQYVRIPYSPTLIASNYTVEAWIEPTTQVRDMINQNLIFGQGYGAVQLVVRTGASGVRVAFLFGTDKYTFHEVASETEIPIGQFTHLMGTWDGTTLRLYINGALDGESSPGAAPVDSGCGFYIGGCDTTGTGYCDYEGQFFSGLIDETAFYRRALSAADVQAIYKAGSAGKHGTGR